MKAWRSPLRIGGVVGAGAAALALLLALDLLPGPKERLLLNSAYLATSSGILVAAIVAARRAVGRLRLTYSLLAVAGAGWCVGNGFWFYYQHVAHRLPFPSWGDIGYLTASTMVAVAVVSFPAARMPGLARSRSVVDALTIILSLVVVSWASVLGPTLRMTGVSSTGKAVAVVYPAVDVLILWVGLSVLARGAARSRAAVLLLVTGIIGYVVADSAWTYMGLRGTYRPGGPTDVGWVFAYVLFLVVALSGARKEEEEEEEEEEAMRALPASAALAPFVPLAVAVGVAMVQAFDSTPDRGTLAIAVVLLGVVLVRQVLVTRENALLHREMESRVQARTAALHRARSARDSILQSAADGICGLDAEGRVLFVNPAAAALLGKKSEEIHGRPFWEVAGVSAPVAVEAAVTRDCVFRGAEGRAFDAECTMTPLVEGGAEVGSVVVFRDVSERRAVERQRLKFTALVSHELRTPLTSLHGALGLLTSGRLDPVEPRGRRMLGIAAANTERLVRLVNDVLELVREETGNLSLDLRECDAPALLGEAVATMRPLAAEHGIRLVAEVEPLEVLADADRVQQVLANLLGNAVKFSPSGSEIVVTIGCLDGEALCSVRDSGRGVPSSHLVSIFEPFHQVDDSDSRDRGGTGLGLAISKGIVERLGGRIWVESEPGRGSSFRFTLPLASERGDDPSPVATGTEIDRGRTPVPAANARVEG